MLSLGWFIYAYRNKSWGFSIISLLLFLPMSIALIRTPLERPLYLLYVLNFIIIIYCIFLSYRMRSKKKLLVSLLLLLLFGVPFVQLGYGIVEEERMNYKTENTKVPIPLVSIDGTTLTIQETYNMCWKITESCMEEDDEPFLLPIDTTVLKEIRVNDKENISIELKNKERAIKSLNVYYIDDKKVKSVTYKGGKDFTLPSNIPEQAVKVTVEMEDTQKFSFSFGIRNGNRYD
jgi:hypothetical protein